MKPGWGMARCLRCDGHGCLSDITADGDFNGAKDCPDCGGSGRIYVSPQGRIADYPGGPFRGFATDHEVAQAKQNPIKP